MRRDTVLLLVGVVLLAAVLVAMWWAWWSSPRITTPGCLSAKDAVIVVYTDRQGLLAEHLILRLSAEWVSKLPSYTKYCVAHEDDIGLHGLPVYPYVVVKGESVIKRLSSIIVNTSIGKGYFPIRADICARLAYETYSYGGEDMPAPRYKRRAELIVINPLPGLVRVKKAQLLSELPELSTRAATSINSATIISSFNHTLPSNPVFPAPVLYSSYDLGWLTPTLMRINSNYYVFKRMGWTLYDLGIVNAVVVGKNAVPEKALLTISLRKRSTTILIVLGNLDTMCSQADSPVLKHIITLYERGKIGLGIAAYAANTDRRSINIYANLAQRNLTPLEAYHRIIGLCKSGNSAQSTTTISAPVTIATKPIRVRPLELARGLPVLIISSRNLNYYIMMKLGNTDIADMDSIIAALSK